MRAASRPAQSRSPLPVCKSWRGRGRHFSPVRRSLNSEVTSEDTAEESCRAASCEKGSTPDPLNFDPVTSAEHS
ncbi:hypothetical protein LDENG_00118920 [Lucifuga dentata]|nr:hypothetical protein LDENG_00118920 [Lucifuga dentata]